MNKHFLFGLGFLLLGSLLSAQITIFGQVTLGQEDGPGIPDWSIEFFRANGNEAGTISTGGDGFYEITLDDVFNEAEELEARTLDICTGAFTTTSFEVVPGQLEYQVNLIICGGIDPPPPTECAPYFYYEQVPSDEGFAVHFFDISHPGEGGITSWSWSFGEGGTSNEQNPVHVYAEEGVYEVLLTIEGEDCAATVVQLVIVHNQENCDCPTDEYDPVCVFTPSGAVLEFVSPCFAECAGYGPDVYTSCSGNECGCPEFYAPVCVAEPDGTIIEFQNHCFAECEGYGPDHWLDCEETCDCPEDVYEPVCVHTPFGGLIEFPNACFAECAGFEPGQYQPCDGGCECPEFYDPICVTLDDGTVLTFSNFCFAQCEGYGPEQWEDCENNCECPEDLYDPVCVATPSGLILTFINPCEAECAGYGPDIYYHCEGNECNCPAVYDPVCVINDFGHIITFDNACFAECAGYGPDHFVECEEDCVCDTGWDPVCVATPDGSIITFSNACIAECEGFTPDQFVDCGDCNCDNYYLPVCVIDPVTGDFLEFGNPCFAICAGYGADDIFPCDNGNECYANFSYVFYDDAELGHRVTFTDESFTLDAITSWFWDFGDGATSTEQNPEHIYDHAGVYDVTLVIETPECGTLTVTYHLCVGEGGGVGGPACQSFFFFEQPNANDLLTFQFIDFSLGNINAWIWDFGDGTISTEQNPMHTYATEGFYLVRLSIVSNECESSVQIGVTAGENVWYGDLACRAWFLPVINPATLEVYFINLSSPDAVQFEWDFGDGNTSTDPLALHGYEEAGMYTVTLTTTSADGCTNTFSVTINLSGEDDGFTSNPVFSLVSSTEEPTTRKAISAAPNPTSNVVQLSWDATTADDYSWQLFDLNGKLLQQQTLRSIGGLNQVELDLSGQAAGIYLFRLQTPEGQRTLRLSKF